MNDRNMSPKTIIMTTIIIIIIIIIIIRERTAFGCYVCADLIAADQLVLPTATASGKL